MQIAMKHSDVLFPGLTRYGNYEEGHLPKKGIRFIPLDGTIRTANKLAIPFRDVVRIELAYGSTYLPRKVGYAIPARYTRALNAAMRKAEAKRDKRPSVTAHSDLILCIREASRAAHRCRDAAANRYARRHYRHLASHWSKKKTEWYSLKDRGIVAAHGAGLLRYAGESPQGLAVYEYGDGGMSCFHSTLHPVGAERRAVEGHPEVLLVDSKSKAKGISLHRVRVTLLAQSDDLAGYERSAPPSMRREPAVIQCWDCGEFGHRSFECERFDDRGIAA